ERDAVSGKFPVIEFEETEHNFGEIPANVPVETVFKYKNIGDAPLVITNIESTCGCTVPEDWSREPLAIGETAQFTVKFNAAGLNKVTKSITLTANTEKGKETVGIAAFLKANPNAPATTPAVNTTPMMGGQQPVKSSKQPGHEGHNHD